MAKEKYIYKGKTPIGIEWKESRMSYGDMAIVGVTVLVSIALFASILASRHTHTTKYINR